MMSYVLLNCSPGSETDVISEIRDISGVSEVNGVLGKYDIFVKISADTPDLLESVISKIRQVRATTSHTLPVIYGQGGTIDNESN